MSVTVRQKAYVAFAAVCLFWGTTYLGIKVALENADGLFKPGMPSTARLAPAGRP